VFRPQIRTSTLLLAVLLLAGCDRGDHPHDVGRTAPDFTVNDGTRSVHLADYRGKVVLLNFWATWCAPCIEELPSLQALHQQMPQVAVLAVSVDEDPDAYRQFLTKHPLNLLTVDDPERRANALYGTFRFPETYVIDRKGVIRRRFISAQDWTNPEIVNYLSHL
jgi:cytochrome c biogenesis protein CcmG/thiol:disulfide interchange protein DsbE